MAEETLEQRVQQIETNLKIAWSVAVILGVVGVGTFFYANTLSGRIDTIKTSTGKLEIFISRMETTSDILKKKINTIDRGVTKSEKEIAVLNVRLEGLGKSIEMGADTIKKSVDNGIKRLSSFNDGIVNDMSIRRKSGISEIKELTNISMRTANKYLKQIRDGEIKLKYSTFQTKRDSITDSKTMLRDDEGICFITGVWGMDHLNNFVYIDIQNGYWVLNSSSGDESITHGMATCLKVVVGEKT